MMEKIIESNKEQDTYDLGYDLGQHAKPGQVFTREFDTLKCKKVPQSLEIGLFFCQIFIFIV